MAMNRTEDMVRIGTSCVHPAILHVNSYILSDLSREWLGRSSHRFASDE